MDVDEDVYFMDYRSPMKTTTNNAVVIETIDATNYQSSSKKSRCSNIYDKNLCKENKPLTDFINKCIFLDQTAGMESIINKVLLPAYAKADAEYKQSDKFIRVITKAFQRLINDPARKYTHISDIVDTLKLHASKAPIVKKRVNFVTLSTKVTVKPNRKRPIIQSSSRVSPKKFKTDVIALDDDDDDVLNKENDDDDIIPINDKVSQDKLYKQVEETENKYSTVKDNLINDETIEIQDSQELKIIEDSQLAEKESNNLMDKYNEDIPIVPAHEPKHQNNNGLIVNENNNEKENLGSIGSSDDGNMLLIPQKEKIVRLEKQKPKKKKEPEEMTEEEKAKRIKVIEATIQKHKNTIARLDLEEVTDDSANSPYYKCDRLRALIVKLYKELCTLTGEEPPERRKIRLQTSEGLPQGPIKRLEKFLNKHANEEGDMPFPDFSDVVRCVGKANQKDGLGWSKTKVMEEAQAIFSYCGRALQRRRQQREWKHLQAQVKPEEFEDDPAERDQALQARLEANRQLAKKREAEVFSRFAHMETQPEPNVSTSVQIEEDPSEADEDSSSAEEPEPSHSTARNIVIKTPNDIQGPTHEETMVLKESINNANLAEKFDSSIVKEEPGEPGEPIKIQYKGDISLVIEISDSESDGEALMDGMLPNLPPVN